MTNENNRNAFAGMNIQILFKNSIVDHPAIIKKLKENTYHQQRQCLD